VAKHSRCTQRDLCGFQMIWARGAEPWRECGLPVQEELDLDPAKVELIHETSRQYFLKYRQVRTASCPPPPLLLGSEQAPPHAHPHNAAWRLTLRRCHLWCQPSGREHGALGPEALLRGYKLTGASRCCRPRGMKQSGARTASTPMARP
jgi:hypothetical protein